MPLIDEIAEARKEIVTDGYDMSVGELINLYRDGELKINPAYQRLFRWDATRKTRLIESILLGLPLPPIFVFQMTDGVWELIDGLQRVSTIMEFVGVLKDASGADVLPSRLEGTKFLPSLTGMGWEASGQNQNDGIGTNQQIQLKRARMRVEILKQESDPLTKFELFQRLNTGGIALSQQEVRNSVAIMLDSTFQDWLVARSENSRFLSTIAQTEIAKERQTHVELALRYFAFRDVPYDSRFDVHEYLDTALVVLATGGGFDRNLEQTIFDRTFLVLDEAMQDSAFKRWDGQNFSGKFLISVFEVVALGVSRNIDAIEQMNQQARTDFIQEKCRALWGMQEFLQYSGGGVRGTTRLANLLQLGPVLFTP